MSRIGDLYERTLGFLVRSEREEKKEKTLQVHVPEESQDGSTVVAEGGYFGSYIDLENKTKDETGLINRYREMVRYPECDSAIQDIVNEAIVTDEEEPPVKIVLEKTDLPEPVKKKVTEEFEYLLNLLDFNNVGYNIFERWYVDGRLYYYLVIDKKSPRDGIQELRYIDPRKIRKVKKQTMKRDPETGELKYGSPKEYFVYNKIGFGTKRAIPGVGGVTKSITLAKDTVCYAHSGLIDDSNKTVVSHLHKAIKSLNQLRMIEDAVVIYRLARAPERRIFYIDVGNLPKIKAEQYLRDMMAKHKNRLVYSAETGEIKDSRKFMTMLEDFWLPRRGEAGKATEITNLPGGQNLGEMDDVEYFRKKLYKSLNVPITRLESEAQFNVGRSSEITRDEIKFSKFIQRLRNRFSLLFLDLLEIQLALKGIISRAEWREVRKKVFFNYLKDNHFNELKELDIMNERISLLGNIDQFADKYFSVPWIQRKVLRFTDDEVKEIEKEREKWQKEHPELMMPPGGDEDGPQGPPPGGPAPHPSVKPDQR